MVFERKMQEVLANIMRKLGKGNWARHHITACVSFLIFIMAGATALVWHSFRTMVNDVEKTYAVTDGEQKHIAFIAEDPSEDFMNAVYKSACQEASKQGIYIEYMGKELSENYSKQELLELAIAAKVDGIILEGDSREVTKMLIAEARKQAIPVVTIRTDCVESERASFVGVNNYSLGHSYGNQILNLSYHKSAHDVVILMDQVASDSGQDIIYSSLCQTLEANPGAKFHIRPMQISREITFDAEEQIRNLFVNNQLPEIVVCLNQLYTNCAIQAVIDQNKVGKTELIGFYDNKMIYDAIQDNVLHCSISINTEQMGKYCLESFLDLWETGHTSEYFAVDTFLINKDTCKELDE